MPRARRSPLVSLALLGILVVLPLLPAAGRVSAAAALPHAMPILPQRLAQWQREGRAIAAAATDPTLLGEKGINRPFRRDTPLLGPINALAVVVQFSDNVHTVTPTFFDHLIFDLPIPGRGSVRDYFDEVSYSQVDVVTVDLPSSLGWITAPQTYAYYVAGDTCFGPYPHNCQKLAEDIVDAIHTAFPALDFSDYDNNDDGVMEPIMIIHAGPGYEDSGDVNDIWSHSWNLAYPRYYDGVTIADYVTMPEYHDTVDPYDSDMTIGVFCHEMGHGFWGFPDLYDYDYSSWGVGYWSLMGYGGYSGPGHDGSSPSWPDAWSRIQAGFETALPLDGPAAATFPPVEGGPAVYRLDSTALHNEEYFLLENRQPLAGTYDEYLPGSGLLIWHIDDTLMGYGPNSNECRNIPHCNGSCAATHYLVALEQADGADHLERKLNGGDAADPFPGSGSRTFWQPYAENPGVNPESGTWFDSLCGIDSCLDLTGIACAALADCTAYVRRSGCRAEAELGDAPAGTNNHGAPMTAYPAAGALPAVMANFPTVYLPLAADPGPRHGSLGSDSWLGDAVSGEWNADLPPDEDGALNLDPAGDLADGDHADDGLALPLVLAPCAETTLAYALTIAPAAPPTARYLNAWIDWNRDGDWGDTLTCTGGLAAPEWAVPDAALTLGPGSHSLTATVAVPAPAVAAGAPLEAWLRLSVAESPAPAPHDGRGPAGGYAAGETEDYRLYLEPALLVAAEPPASAGPGEAFTYTVQLDGQGNVIAAGAVVSNTLPPEVAYLSSIPAGTYDPAAHSVSWPADLVPGEARQWTVRVQVAESISACTALTDSAALLWAGTPWQAAEVTLNAGCRDGDPQAAFSFSVPACRGAAVDFSNSSTGTMPLAYAWDLDGDGLPDSSAAEPTWVYGAAGDYTVTLSAANCCGTSVVSGVVHVLQPLDGLAVEGPAQLQVGEAAVYTASPIPPDAAGPTYLWDNGSTAVTATYSWDTPGTHTIAVTGSSACGAVQGSLEVLVSSPCVSLTGVTIAGPARVRAGEAGTWTASPEPLTATNPAYLWSSGSTTATAAYSWPTPGTYEVTVTATNCLDVVVTDGLAVIVWREYRFYLPLVVRGRP